MHLEKKKVMAELKIVGKIQLSEEDLNKKRFRDGQSQYNHVAKIDGKGAENNANGNDCISGEAAKTVDSIYSTLEKVEKSRERKSQVTDLRTLLEFAFALRLYPTTKFSERKANKNLAAFVEEYYKKYPKESSARSLVDEVRKRLNHIIHNSIFMEVADEEMNGLFLKVHCILDGLFCRHSESRFVMASLTFTDVNEEQKAAVESTSSVILVNSGPGTGKTHLIVDRMMYSSRRSGDKSIIGLAYTNEAAKQLRDRYVYTVFGTNDYESVDKISICTIHSFAFNTLKSFSESSGRPFDYEIVDEIEEKEIREDFRHNNDLISEYMQENSLVTFNGILKMFDEAVRTDADLKQYLRDNVYEIILDESQDASMDAARLLKDIYDVSSGSIKIFMVGDQRQNIFAFNTGSMLNFKSVGFEPTQYSLHRCYRCPNTVLDLVNRFSFRDCKNEDLKNEHAFGVNVKEELPTYTEYPDEYAEMLGIISEIKKLKSSQDIEYRDIAILFPTSYPFKVYGERFNAEGIPFKCYGGQTELLVSIRMLLYCLGAIEKNKYSFKKLFAHFDLDLASDVGIKNEEELLVVAEFSPIARKYVEMLRRFRPLVDAGEYFVADAVDVYAEKTGEALMKEFSLAVRESGVRTYKELKQKMSPNVPAFGQFYNRANMVKSLAGIKDHVVISTIHSAKGKEWQYVFIPGVTDGKYPSYKRNVSGTEMIAHENNEMKKFYVACTRALKKLYFSWTDSYSVGGYEFDHRKMSKYLADKLDLLEVVHSKSVF